MTDADIDTGDILPLDERFFANARLRMPKRKESITIRLDPDILVWFKSLGKGYQTRINAVLRAYMEMSGQVQAVHETREAYRVSSPGKASGRE
jgi:uncharacterized protein (DUF4415 family)